MASVAENAGPWGMAVFSYDETDPHNPLARLRADDLARLPFGAIELDAAGVVACFHDTEPDPAGGDRNRLVGRNFFSDSAVWARDTVMHAEFLRGVESGSMNAVFDCAVPGQGGKVRIHLKVSPILGTFWMFIKRLRRGS